MRTQGTEDKVLKQVLNVKNSFNSENCRAKHKKCKIMFDKTEFMRYNNMVSQYVYLIPVLIFVRIMICRGFLYQKPL